MKLLLRFMLGFSVYVLWVVVFLLFIAQIYWAAGLLLLLSLIPMCLDGLVKKRMKGFDPLP